MQPIHMHPISQASLNLDTQRAHSTRRWHCKRTSIPRVSFSFRPLSISASKIYRTSTGNPKCAPLNSLFLFLFFRVNPKRGKRVRSAPEPEETETESGSPDQKPIDPAVSLI